MATFKTMLLLALAGALIGAVVATLVAPGMLAWYNTPGHGATQMLCDYAELTRGISRSLIEAQLTGGGIGMVASVVLGGLVLRARSRNRPPPAPSPVVP